MFESRGTVTRHATHRTAFTAGTVSTTRTTATGTRNGARASTAHTVTTTATRPPMAFTAPPADTPELFGSHMMAHPLHDGRPHRFRTAGHAPSTAPISVPATAPIAAPRPAARTRPSSSPARPHQIALNTHSSSCFNQGRGCGIQVMSQPRTIYFLPVFLSRWNARRPLGTIFPLLRCGPPLRPRARWLTASRLLRPVDGFFLAP